MTPATTYPSIVGAVIARLRERAGVRQAELATKVGVAASTWSRAERGLSALTIDQLALAASALGSRPGAILAAADRVREVITARGMRVTSIRMSHSEAAHSGIVLVSDDVLAVLVGGVE